MKNDKSLINELLREDGIEPFGVSDKERRDLRDVLEAERRRVKRLAWLVQVPLWFFAVLMLLFCVSERLLDTLRIQFVAGWGLVLVACVVLFPISFKLLGRLKAKRARLRRLYKLMPEYAEKCRGGIIIVGRRDGKRVIRWPAVITLGITISLIMGLGASGVYYLLSGRWSPVVILYIGLMGIGGVAVGVYDGLKTAPEELTELKASESSTWRTIMKSRITKLAAAAVIKVTVIVSLRLYTGSVDITTPAFAVSDVITAMQRTPWLHATGQWVGDTNNVPPDTLKQWEKAEWWYSIDPYRMFIIEQGGKIEVTTSDSIKLYDPKNNTITVTSPHHPEETPPASMPVIYLRAISELEKRGARVQYSDSTYGDRSAKIINVDYSTEEGFRGKITIIADAKTRLAKKMILYQASAGESGTLSMVFDYPSSGPADIYEAGAPRDAEVKVVDN